MDRKPTKQEEKEFILGNKAADLWLTICDACANEKVIPKKYRYTTGTGLMNTAESICGDIEEANLIDLREAPRDRLMLQRKALRECKKLERKIIRMKESDQYPGVNSHKASALSQGIHDRALYVRGLVRKGQGPRCGHENGCRTVRTGAAISHPAPCCLSLGYGLFAPSTGACAPRTPTPTTRTTSTPTAP